MTVVEDAIRPVEVEPGDGERALEEMREAGAHVARSEDVVAAAGRAASAAGRAGS